MPFVCGDTCTQGDCLTVTALVQQTGNETSTDQGNPASRKETVSKVFCFERYIRRPRDDQETSENDVTETGDTCNLVPGFLLVLSSGIEPLY